MSDLRIAGGSVLRDGRFAIDELAICEGRIAPAASRHARHIDATGLLILPGIVDIHGDAFERQIMPRNGVFFPLEMALRDTDAQVLANGITTVFHGLTWSWEPGLRGPEAAHRFVAEIERLRPVLRARTHVHLRQETFNLDAEAEIVDWLQRGLVQVLAFNDHMTGTVKDRHRPDKISTMVKRSGLTAAGFDELIDRVWSRRAEVPASIGRLAAVARGAGVPLLSHDDMSPDQRSWFRELGCTIAEFPIDEVTAAAAHQSGDEIVFGAPNVVRGGSHTGCPDAAEMVRQGQCTILASDYYYPAILAAPFRLAEKNILPLHEAWQLVSRNPAEALGLDAGQIREGAPADVVIVDASGASPEVLATIVGGRIVHCRDDRFWL